MHNSGLTDKDARSVILHRNIVNVGYCVQASSDAKHKLFVNNDTGTVNDTHSLSPIAIDAKELLGLEKLNVLSDKGYTTGKQLALCEANEITTYSSPKAHSSQKNDLCYNLRRLMSIFDLKTLKNRLKGLLSKFLIPIHSIFNRF